MKTRPCESQLRVRYAETDQMGVVYHSNFIIWFEVGRVDALRRLGFSYKQLEQQGYHLPVVDVRCRYKAPARYDDVITVRTTIRNVRNSMIHFHYEVLRAEHNELLAEGETVHFVIGNDGNKCPLPEDYFAALQSAVAK